MNRARSPATRRSSSSRARTRTGPDAKPSRTPTRVTRSRRWTTPRHLTTRSRRWTTPRHLTTRSRRWTTPRHLTTRSRRWTTPRHLTTRSRRAVSDWARIMTTTQQGAAPAAGTLAPSSEHPPDRPDQAVSPQPARTGEQTVEPVSGLAQLARILGTIVAPTTLLTSVLFYFGWMHAYHFFDYFGVNSTVLGLTTQDYLMRSLDGLFVPMTVVACAGLLVLWGHAVLRARLADGSRPWVLRVFVPAMATVGLLLTVCGLLSVLL